MFVSTDQMPDIYQVAMSDLRTPTVLDADSFCDLYERVVGEYDGYVFQSDLIMVLRDRVAEHGSDHDLIMGWFDDLVAGRGMRVDMFVRTLEAVSPVRFSDVVPLLAGRSDSVLVEMLPTPEDWFDFQQRIMVDPTVSRLRNWLGRRFYGRPLTEHEAPGVHPVARVCVRFGCEPLTLSGSKFSV